MAHILLVGNATLDWIDSVDHYPAEDAEIRAHSRQARCGGNALNSAIALTRLGHQCGWSGTLADDAAADQIRQQLQQQAIAAVAVTTHPNAATPVSHILLSCANGSRTIIHYRDLPEYRASAFRSALTARHWDWIHFEGRDNVPELQQMIAQLKRLPQPPRCSLELEKSRPDIEQLLPQVDLLLCARHYAEQHGYPSASALLQALRLQLPAPHPLLVCGWGSGGATALDPNHSTPYQRPAQPPPQLVDTLAAGDTFNAAIIDQLLRQQPLTRALDFAITLAGRKCAHHGIRW